MPTTPASYTHQRARTHAHTRPHHTPHQAGAPLPPRPRGYRICCPSPAPPSALTRGRPARGSVTQRHQTSNAKRGLPCPRTPARLPAPPLRWRRSAVGLPPRVTTDALRSVPSLPLLDHRCSVVPFRPAGRFITSAAWGLRLPVARRCPNVRRVGWPAGALPPSCVRYASAASRKRAAPPRLLGAHRPLNITPPAAGAFTFNHCVTPSRSRPPRTTFERKPSPVADFLLAYMRVGAGAPSPSLRRVWLIWWLRPHAPAINQR